MTTEALTYIGDKLVAAGLNYQFGQFNYSGKTPPYPYFVGTYSEQGDTAEDGGQTVSFTLSGWTRGSWLDLEQAKEKVRRLFGTTGTTAILENSGLAVSYSTAQPIPTGDAELKRIDINLTIKEWSV